MSKTATVKLTAAIGIAGNLLRAGTIVEIPEAAAKDLLRRGKAELATEHDEVTAVLDSEDDRQAEADAATEAAAAEASKTAKAKK